MSDRLLIIFLKAPRPGLVKTRIAVSQGADAATEIYRSMLTTLAGHLKSLAPVELHFTPADARAEVLEWAEPGWSLQPQPDGKLGDRLHQAFLSAFARGAKRVAIIGSDCPELAASDVESAWNGLLSHDVVLGPAKDGGYWLVALGRPMPELFRNIAWGSDTVLQDTLKRCHSLSLRSLLLRELEDIDTEADWSRYLERATARTTSRPIENGPAPVTHGPVPKR